MKKPLSYSTYFLGNVKKTLSLIITITFSIILIGSNHMFIVNSLEMGTQVSIQYKKFTLIDGQEEDISEDYIKQLEAHQDVNRVIPVEIGFMDYQGVAIAAFGSIIYMNESDVLYMMELLDIEHDSSLLPQLDANEAIVNENLLKNNDLKIGSKFNDLKIVGTFTSDYIIGISSKTIQTKTNYIVVPNEGKLEIVNDFIEQTNSNEYRLLDVDQLEGFNEGVMGDAKNLFDIITVIILLSVGIGLGISTYVHYYQRRKEFGILNGLGYTQSYILKRINKEIILTSIFALMFALVLLEVEIILMNVLLLKKEGLPPFKIDLELFSRILIIPLFTSVFSLVPTWVLLKKIDSVSIIEGVN